MNTTERGEPYRRTVDDVMTTRSEKPSETGKRYIMHSQKNGKGSGRKKVVRREGELQENEHMNLCDFPLPPFMLLYKLRCPTCTSIPLFLRINEYSSEIISTIT